MSHTTIVYPNGMVEVVNEEDVEALDTDPVEDALAVLDEYFANHGAARVALNVLHAVYDEENIGQDEHAGLHSV